MLDRNAREDELQINQLGERLTDLNEEYRQMKIQFEQQIKQLEVKLFSCSLQTPNEF